MWHCETCTLNEDVTWSKPYYSFLFTSWSPFSCYKKNPTQYCWHIFHSTVPPLHYPATLSLPHSTPTLPHYTFSTSSPCFSDTTHHIITSHNRRTHITSQNTRSSLHPHYATYHHHHISIPISPRHTHHVSVTSHTTITTPPSITTCTINSPFLLHCKHSRHQTPSSCPYLSLLFTLYHLITSSAHHIHYRHENLLLTTWTHLRGRYDDTSPP